MRENPRMRNLQTAAVTMLRAYYEHLVHRLHLEIFQESVQVAVLFKFEVSSTFTRASYDYLSIASVGNRRE